MHKDVIAFVNDALQLGKTVALALLVESGRDTPGTPGAMLALCPDGTHAGTVGGGPLEARIVADCERALASPKTATLAFDHSLEASGDLGMVCGGQVRGVITVMRPEKRLIIFGGGHVGQKIYEAGLVAGFRVTVVEERMEYAERFPRGETVVTDDFAAAARQMTITPDCCVVIVTRGHAQDFGVLAALARSGCGYLGMIGSRKKVARHFAMLREEGVPEEDIARIYAPVGMDIDDGTPGEIALAIMAEIVAVKNGREFRHCRDRA